MCDNSCSSGTQKLGESVVEGDVRVSQDWRLSKMVEGNAALRAVMRRARSSAKSENLL